MRPNDSQAKQSRHPNDKCRHQIDQCRHPNENKAMQFRNPIDNSRCPVDKCKHPSDAVMWTPKQAQLNGSCGCEFGCLGI